MNPASLAKLDQALAEYGALLSEAVERMRNALRHPDSIPELTVAHIAWAMQDIAETHPALRQMIISEYAVALYRLACNESC